MLVSCPSLYTIVLTDFRENFRSYISWSATDGGEWAVDFSGQTKVSQLQTEEVAVTMLHL